MDFCSGKQGSGQQWDERLLPHLQRVALGQQGQQNLGVKAGEAHRAETAPGRALPLAFELLHDLQEAVVGGRVAAEADLHLVQVGERILHLRAGRC